MENIKIACSCDNNYVPHCGALIASIFANNKENNVEVNVLTDGIDEDNINKLLALARDFNQVVIVRKVEPTVFSAFLNLESKIKLPIQTYFRLIIPTMFKDYDKILYLDVDMIVCSSLAEVWNLDLNNKVIAGVPDTARNITPGCKRLEYPQSDSYFNAGFGLYNLRAMRKSNLLDKAKYIAEKYPEKLLYHDQDLLNLIYHGQFLEISLKWNFMQPFFMQKPSVVDRQKSEVEKYINHPYIIHFTASLKPWFIECDHPYRSVYWSYLKMTPWKDRKPVHIYRNVNTFIKYLRYRLLELKFYLKRDKSRILRKDISFS